jgi:hypothetical protein
MARAVDDRGFQDRRSVSRDTKGTLSLLPEPDRFSLRRRFILGLKVRIDGKHADRL